VRLCVCHVFSDTHIALHKKLADAKSLLLDTTLAAACLWMLGMQKIAGKPSDGRMDSPMENGHRIRA
jgi:hypothetical protein